MARHPDSPTRRFSRRGSLDREKGENLPMTAHDHGYGYQRPFSHPEMIRGLEEGGFCEIRFEWVGCIPALAKAMIAVPRKPG